MAQQQALPAEEQQGLALSPGLPWESATEGAKYRP
jgi:hypothetical protein